MNIDLHIHTTASDGRSTPAEVVRRAAGLGMTAIAITDHDTVEGIEEAITEARQHPGLLVIPGLELGADVPRGEMHILGYFVDHNSRELCRTLETLRNSRANRGQRMVSKLRGHGIHLDWEYVLAVADGASIGRPHLAQAMLEQGYISCVQEAFDRYIGEEGPCFVERKKLGPLESVKLIARTGGLPVLAHPAETEDLEMVISDLMRTGLVGIETYYKGYDRQTTARLVEVGRRFGLVCCGGSDYHGFEDEANEIGNCDVPPDVIDQLLAMKGRAER